MLGKRRQALARHARLRVERLQYGLGDLFWIREPGRMPDYRRQAAVQARSARAPDHRQDGLGRTAGVAPAQLLEDGAGAGADVRPPPRKPCEQPRDVAGPVAGQVPERPVRVVHEIPVVGRHAVGAHVSRSMRSAAPKGASSAMRPTSRGLQAWRRMARPLIARPALSPPAARMSSRADMASRWTSSSSSMRAAPSTASAMQPAPGAPCSVCATRRDRRDAATPAGEPDDSSDSIRPSQRGAAPPYAPPIMNAA